MACSCDNITISPALLGELEKSKDPLPRKLWPTMGGCDEEQVDMHESNKSMFDKMHGEDQMAVDKLKEGIDGTCSCQMLHSPSRMPARRVCLQNARVAASCSTAETVRAMAHNVL